MARQSGIYSTPEKYTQPYEISLNIAEYIYITTFKKIYYTPFTTIISTKKYQLKFLKTWQHFLGST
jgi:hypothetical protein